MYLVNGKDFAGTASAEICGLSCPGLSRTATGQKECPEGKEWAAQERMWEGNQVRYENGRNVPPMCCK